MIDIYTFLDNNYNTTFDNKTFHMNSTWGYLQIFATILEIIFYFQKAKTTSKCSCRKNSGGKNIIVNYRLPWEELKVRKMITTLIKILHKIAIFQYRLNQFQIDLMVMMILIAHLIHHLAKIICIFPLSIPKKEIRTDLQF